MNLRPGPPPICQLRFSVIRCAALFSPPARYAPARERQSRLHRKYQCRDLDGSCRGPWFRTAASKVSFGVRCLSGIIPSQSGSDALFASRKQWTALARYLSALPMANTPELLHLKNALGAKRVSVMCVTESLAPRHRDPHHRTYWQGWSKMFSWSTEAFATRSL